MNEDAKAGTQAAPRAGSALRVGLQKGWRGYCWLLKILIPISFATFLLAFSGWLHMLDGLLVPAMALLGLPPEAALVLLIGTLTGIYGAVAAMAVLGLTQSQMTLIAVFLLISHALIQEGIIQGKSGFSSLKATGVRLVASTVTVVILRFFLQGADPAAVSSVAPAPAAASGFLPLIGDWGLETLFLAAKILVIIMALMIVLELMKSFDLLEILVRRLGPLLRLLGLSPRVGFLWLAAGLFGISYGAAVIVEETRHGRYDPEELNRLHVSIGINHAMVEDPALFLALGIGAFWLWAPRLVAAVTAVQLYRFWRWARRRLKPRRMPRPSRDFG